MKTLLASLFRVDILNNGKLIPGCNKIACDMDYKKKVAASRSNNSKNRKKENVNKCAIIKLITLLVVLYLHAEFKCVNCEPFKRLHQQISLEFANKTTHNSTQSSYNQRILMPYIDDQVKSLLPNSDYSIAIPNINKQLITISSTETKNSTDKNIDNLKDLHIVTVEAKDKHEIQTHSNITRVNTVNNNDASVNKSQVNKTEHQESAEKNNYGELNVSESRDMWHAVDHQDGYSNADADDVPSSHAEDDDLDSPSSSDSDTASATMSEQKVVRELTKLISKGLSEVSDTLPIDRLENIKQKQRERKAIKDQRAKVYEDLLTAAINNHAERIDKKKKRRKSPSSISQNHRGSSNEPREVKSFLSNQLESPELGIDSEYLFNKLQAISTLAEDVRGGTSSGYQDAEEDATNEETPQSNSSTSSDDETQQQQTLNESSSKSTDSSKEQPDEPKNDGKIVKHFKKIKKQLMQRRKQLDQIKNIFNVELSLNPKDGSLLGKTASSEKKSKKDSSKDNDSDEFTVIDDYVVNKKQPRSASHHKLTSAKSAARVVKSKSMRDLILYLRTNPEVLNTIMSELADNEGLRKSSLDIEHPLYPRQLNSVNMMDPDRPISHAKSRRHLAHMYDSETSRNGHFSRRRSTMEPVETTLTVPAKASSSQQHMLEALKELQLKNLARLEMALDGGNQAQSIKNLNSTIALQKNHNSLINIEPQIESSKFSNSDESSNRETSSFLPFNQTDRRSSDNKITYKLISANNNNNNQLNDSRIDFADLKMTQPEQVIRTDVYSFMAKPNNGRNNHNMPQQVDQMKITQQRQHQVQSDHTTTSAEYQNQNSDQAGLDALDRFRNWKDVSQNEAGNHVYQLNKDKYSPLLMDMYDLSTGGSTADSNALNLFGSNKQSSPSLQDNKLIPSKQQHHLAISFGSSSSDGQMSSSSDRLMTRINDVMSTTTTSPADLDNEGSDKESFSSGENKENKYNKQEQDSLNGRGPRDYFSAYKVVSTSTADPISEHLMEQLQIRRSMVPVSESELSFKKGTYELKQRRPRSRPRPLTLIPGHID